MIERITCAVNGINVPDVFSTCYTLISAVSQAALLCKRFVSTCKHVNYLSTLINYTPVLLVLQL